MLNETHSYAQGVIDRLTKVEKSNISDGYHTFEELYEHRNLLYVLLTNIMDNEGLGVVWKAKQRHNGESCDGRFLCCLETVAGQISFHLPAELWDSCNVAAYEIAPVPVDECTSDDISERLMELMLDY